MLSHRDHRQHRIPVAHCVTEPFEHHDAAALAAHVTVGAGIEFGLVENLSGKIEYDFYDFGSKNYNFNAITPVSVRSNLHALTVGLNYKFNWSGGPKP